MLLREYQKEARTTAIYPVENRIIYPALKLNGEAGEVAELVGKALRDENGRFSDERKQKIFKELGDVLWYIANLAADLGFNLEDIATENLRKLASRKKRGKLKGDGDER